MRTSILDNGGFAYAKIDLEELDKILPDLKRKQNEYQKLKLEGAEVTELEKEIREISEQVEEMEKKMTSIYEHSAESFAERETALWAVTNFLFWEDLSPVFPGNTDESKKEKYYAYFDEPESFQAELQAFSTAYLVLDAFLFKGFSADEIKAVLNQNE